MNPVKTSLVSLFILSASVVSAQQANLVIPMGHAQRVNYIETSFDFKLLGSVDDSNIIHIWDTESRREMYQLNSHSAPIVNLDFHPTKNEMISSDQDGNIYIWDTSNFMVTKTIETGDTGVLISYLPDGSAIVAGGKTKLTIYESSTWQSTESIELTSAVTSMAYSKFIENLYVGTQSGELRGYKIAGMEMVHSSQERKQAITAIATYDYKSAIVLGYSDGQIMALNPTENKIFHSEKIFPHTVGGLLVDSKNGGIIASGRGEDSESDVKLLDKDLNKDGKFRWSSRRTNDESLKALCWADNEFDKAYIADHANVIRVFKSRDRSWEDGTFIGTARPIYDIDVDANGEKLIIASRNNQLKVFDLTGATYPILLDGHKGGIVQLDYHPDLNMALAVGRDNEIKVWDLEQQEMKSQLKKVDFLDFNIEFIGEDTYIRKIGVNTYEAYNFKAESGKKLEVEGAFDMKVSPDASTVVFKKTDGLYLYQSYDLTFVGVIPMAGILDYSFDEGQIIALTNSNEVMFFDGLTQIKKLTVDKRGDKIQGFPSGEFFIYSSNGSRSNDFTAYHFTNSGKLQSELAGHHDYITKVLKVKDNILTSSLDGSIKIWEGKSNSYTEVGSFIPMRFDKFVITTPGQLFDASSDVMQEMHYTKGAEIIALEQLKNFYFEPNLLPKLINTGSEGLRKTTNISDLGAAPLVELVKHPNKDGGILSFKVIDKGGGIGKVSLVINGKEVSNDLTQSRDAGVEQLIEYDIKGHPYLYEAKPSRIVIKAYNKDASIGSEPKNIFVLPTSDQKSTIKPKIFAIVIGTADYAGDEMDLKYAAKDATDFAAALRISSSNLIGGENMKMTVLTTDRPENEWPTKENIRKTFEKYATEASARDYLIVYMAGHGVNSGGEDGDFYYLTCTAKDGKVFEQETRDKHAISSYEFTEYIKSVPALNQVMIVDACHSGTLTSAFGKEKVSKTMSSEEVKAYERMKDRTGIFLLAGSAADAVSYETTLYGQGLLTYALLFGMKGAALHEGEYIDVLDLFQFASKKVPQLAADIGGIQRPEVRVPSEVESFNIGKMTDSDKQSIKLLSPKPVFVHTSFQDSELFYDAKGLGNSLDSRLTQLSKEENAPIIFMNENRFSGAYIVRGRYEQKGALTIVDVKVFEDDKKKLEFKVDGTSANSIADKIAARLQKMIEG